MTSTAQGPRAQLACVVLAHEHPEQVRRLVCALAPLPVFLHVDRRVPDTRWAEFTKDLPEHVSLTPRVPTAWATLGAVTAELLAYEEVLAGTSATHVAFLSGSDYPLVSVDHLTEVLTPLIGTSVAAFRPLPIPGWGMGGGLGRLRYRHWAWHRHVIRLPLPRRLPTGLTLAGGPVQKILARHHVEALLHAVTRRPDLVSFWERAWAPDETLVATILSTPDLVPGWAEQHLDELAWVIDWRRKRISGPPWLTLEHLPALRDVHGDQGQQIPKLFARKFHPVLSAPLLDVLDEARAAPHRGTGRTSA